MGEASASSGIPEEWCAGLRQQATVYYIPEKRRPMHRMDENSAIQYRTTGGKIS
jgi:hypothetical protein